MTIARLALSPREVDGPAGDPPPPRIGERGTIVDDLGDDIYLVEHATDDGMVVWIAEFHATELMLVERAEDGATG